MGHKITNFKRANKMIRILKKGSVKVKEDGKKVKKSIVPFEEETLKNPVLARSESLPTYSDVIIPGSDADVAQLTVNTWNLSLPEFYWQPRQTLLCNEIPTYVHVLKKDDTAKAFDFMDDGILGEILRSSTLGGCYPKIKEKWQLLFEGDLREDETNVLYLQNLHVIMGPDGKIVKYPEKMNLLILSMPSKKQYQGAAESDENYVLTEAKISAKIVRTIVETLVQLHCIYAVIDPFPNGYKLFQEDEHQTATIWRNILEENDPSKQLKHIDFCVEDEDSYVIFDRNCKSKEVNETLSETMDESPSDPMIL